MKKLATVVLLLATAAFVLAQGAQVQGLDHIPIAVNDLARAAERYRALGFSLKPGRPHDNGITNQHVKFPDGSELELITAPEASRTNCARFCVTCSSGSMSTRARAG